MKKICTIYSGDRLSASGIRWCLIFVEQRVLSFTGSRTNELYFSCACNQWQRTDHARARSLSLSLFLSPLSPLDANKSRNSDAPSTRGFHVCQWNLISAAFVTKHAALLFSPISTHPPLPPPSPPPLFILCARFSARYRGIDRETRSSLQIRDTHPDEIRTKQQIRINRIARCVRAVCQSGIPCTLIPVDRTPAVSERGKSRQSARIDLIDS